MMFPPCGYDECGTLLQCSLVRPFFKKLLVNVPVCKRVERLMVSWGGLIGKVCGGLHRHEMVNLHPPA